MKRYLIILFLPLSLHGAEFIYPDKFSIEATALNFTYKDKVREFSLEVLDCNKSILQSVVENLESSSTGYNVNLIKSSKKYFYKNKKKVRFNLGSRLHKRLENTPKTIDSVIFRAKMSCKKS
ncbi:MAG: hypothetical protein ACJAS4_002812 [Bacteriovoracaceae bacterium]|jgi:hypothetical protein